MNIRYYTKYIAVFIFISISNVSLATNTIRTYPHLTMHGDTFENSCSPKSKEKLIDNIRKNIVYDNRKLQNAINLILCGDKNSGNRKKMINLINDIVITSYEGTGEEKIETESRKKIEILKFIMAAGRAWDATLIFDDKDVKLQYFSNEACVKSVRLRYVRNSWIIHQIGEACD